MRKLRRYTKKHLNKHRIAKRAEQAAELEAEAKLKRPLPGSKRIDRSLEGCDA